MKALSPALYASLVASPAFAHSGDHGELHSITAVADHISSSPFHTALGALAIVLGFVGVVAGLKRAKNRA